MIALSAHEGARTALVRFTGIDWETQARIEAFVRRTGMRSGIAPPECLSR